MEPQFTLFSIIMLLGAAQGLFLSLALINTQKGKGTDHFFLAIYTIAFSVDLGHEFLFQTRYLLDFLALVSVDPVINLLYGPSFYLYVRALTEGSAFRLAGKEWLHFLPLGLSIAVLLVIPGLSSEQYQSALYGGEVADTQSLETYQRVIGIIAMTSVISIGAYIVLSLVRLVKHAKRIRQQFSYIEKITLNWLRNLLIALFVLYSILIFDGFFSGWLELNENINKVLYLMIVAVIYTMGYLGLNQPAIFTAQPVAESDANERDDRSPKSTLHEENIRSKYKSSALDSQMSRAIKEELEKYMAQNSPHLEPQLTLPGLAHQLGISSNYLSQVINEQFDKNFFDFINDYRVEEAIKMLSDTDKSRVNILNIAFDSGFKSKSAFYTAFKKKMGITPSAFRSAKLEDA